MLGRERGVSRELETFSKMFLMELSKMFSTMSSKMFSMMFSKMFSMVSPLAPPSLGFGLSWLCGGCEDVKDVGLGAIHDLAQPRTQCPWTDMSEGVAPRPAPGLLPSPFRILGQSTKRLTK